MLILSLTYHNSGSSSAANSKHWGVAAVGLPFLHLMNLLYHHHHHHHHYFQFRKRQSPNSSNCVSLINEKTWLRMRMRCKSESESKWDGDRGGRGVAVAARDRIITFGRYKGKMLGSVPSMHLKWVSNNLREGLFEGWAKLADQVLQDPIYRYRIEWELALNALNGDKLNLNLRTTMSITSSSSAVSQLLDVNDRFGWDNQDKLGWGKVDFDLLGTSKGGRIPRRLGLVNHSHAQLQHKDPHLHPSTSTSNSTCLTITLNKSSTRRMQRRERQKNIRLRAKAQQEEQALHQQQDNKNNVNAINVGNDDEDDEDDEMVRQNRNGAAESE